MSKEFFTAPFPVEDEQSVIWRYMDFTKFVSLLDKRSLFLCRADKLSDPFEGSASERDVEASKSDFYKHKILEGSMGYAKMQESLQKISDGFNLMRRFVHVSSWYMKEYESAAMWQLYTQTNEAVAIKSTYKHLQESLPSSDKLLIGKVNYIDYKKQQMDGEWINRFFHKRKSYEHEEEMRVILFYTDAEWLSTIQAVEIEDGVYIKTKIDTLIDEIYVAPNSPDWFQELVENITKLYGIHKEVNRTSLDDKVLY